jgi:hypothetical protein
VILELKSVTTAMKNAIESFKGRLAEAEGRLQTQQ